MKKHHACQAKSVFHKSASTPTRICLNVTPHLIWVSIYVNHPLRVLPRRDGLSVVQGVGADFMIIVTAPR